MLTEKVRNERPEAAGDTDMASADTVTLIKQNHGHQAKQCNAGASVYRGEKRQIHTFWQIFKSQCIGTEKPSLTIILNLNSALIITNYISASNTLKYQTHLSFKKELNSFHLVSNY